MRVCIVGAGAIGGYLAAKLALAGTEVGVIARGANLAAIQADGLILQNNERTEQQHVHVAVVTDDPNKAGTFDVVIAAVKTHQLPAIAPAMRALYHETTMVVPAQNGIPWWYFHGYGGPYDGRRIMAVDPAGILEQQIEYERIIGCAVYPATELVAPGVIRHIERDRFTLGELDGSRSPRIQQLSQLLVGAGLTAPIRNRIRNEIWVKLWGNLAFNPVSALTGATMGQICRFAPSRALVATLMAEAKAVAEQLGIDFGVSIEQRIAGAEQIGEHKTSMLQDIEAGRSTEIDALVGAVAELGDLVGIETPQLDALAAAVRLLEHVRAL
jgi:2-dehydropantoate 2-reductase